MRANEIIRGVLNLIDQIDCVNQQAAQAAPQPAVAVLTQVEPVAPEEIAPQQEFPEDDEARRFTQIMDILMQKERPTMYDNSPNQSVAGINSVTKDAGGGLNGPKHPADIRADSVGMYPNSQYRPGV